MLYLTVHLYGKRGVRGEFRQYEQKALDIFRRHGGEIMAAFVPAPREPGTDVPDEIQILRIPDRARFEAFMRDPDRVKLSEERAAVIRRTETYLSEDLIEY